MKLKALTKLTLALLIIIPGCFFIGGSHVNLPKIDTVGQLEKLFPKSAKEIEQLTDSVIKATKGELEKLYNISKENRTFDNTAKQLDLISSNLSIKAACIAVLEMVNPNADIRNAAHTASIKLNNFSIDNFSQNKKLYQAFKEYAENNANKENLTKVQKYFIQEEMDAFKLSGLHLNDKDQEKLKEIKKELSNASLRFDKNIAQDNRFIKLKKEDLTGLSDNFINNLEKDENNLYKLGVDYPTYYYVMENAKKESTRRALWKEFVNRGYPQNLAELKTIIALRDQKAKLIGFDSYAQLDIYNQMAKSTKTVEDFLNNLVSKANIKAKKEIQELTKDLPKEITLTKENKIKSWDGSYLKNYYKKKYLNIDEEEISNYFPLDNTLKELFSIYEKFFGLKFKEAKINNIWHDSVQLLEVYKDNKFIGYVLLDLFPRENKYSHACQVGLTPAINNADGYLPAVVLVIANFPKSNGNQPALLKRDDVITFFHEFGHAIHSLLGATTLSSQSGTNVKRDFVEMPSQMLEEWMWQPKILKQISKHYKTNEQLPDELINKIVNLKSFDSGTRTLMQLFYSFVSLDLFKAGANKDPHEIIKNLYKNILTSFDYNEDYRFYTAFGHLTGYGAKYYGYLWSKVFALDLFDHIKNAGYFGGIGQKYTQEVISKGGSQDPMELLENFLCRKPNQKAFLKDFGL